jgi:DNA mismatch repair protein MutS
MSLIKEYFELTKKYENEYGKNTILLMQVGSFFEVYGIFNKESEVISESKIIEFSQICELNIVEKSNCSNIVMAGFKDIMIEKYTKKIQDAGFTAVVYIQDESGKNTTRSLAGIFSPGTYFHTETTKLTNSICCIWVQLVENKLIMKGKYVIVGIANIDIFTGKTNIFQFKEIYINSPTTYDELERFISIYNPSETIIISNLPTEKEIDNIISYSGITSNLIHKIHIKECNNTDDIIIKQVLSCEKQPYQKEILSKFYKFDDFHIFIQNCYDNNIATQSLCYLLNFIYKHNPHLVNKLSEPIFENCSTRLILANHSLKQLNIINDGNVKSNKYSCICNMLNECLTPMGKRKFTYNLLNPTFDKNYLQKEYDIIEYFLTKYTDYNNFLKNNLNTIKDISKWERQIILKKISPKAFYSLFNNISIIKKIYGNIIEDKNIINYLQNYESNILKISEYCDSITNFISKNLDLSLAKELEQLHNFENNFINTGIDEELDKKTNNLKDSEYKLEAIRVYFNSIIETAEKKKSLKTTEYIKIHETEKNNFSLVSTIRRCKLLSESLPKDPTIILLPLNSENTKQFEFKVSKIQFNFEKQSTSNNFIVDEQIIKLCKNISSSKLLMKDLITSVFNKFISIFENFQPQIESIINFITLIDLLYTKSSIALKYNYCKPNIISSEKSFVDATQLRHCLIEQFQSNELYVSNDISLGNKDGIDGILLYGTNAVGKTTIIRALGIAIIMAQSGLYVPCSSFNYQPYKYLFTRIIGNDNIFKGLSTFAVEMSELRTILRLTDENSLILGDELCSGTEISSAISIFVTGIRKLHNCRSSFIFATHLHEIVDYEEIKNLNALAIKHMEVIYDKENDILIYDRKLKDGTGNNMYGLEVCKSLSLPQDFLDEAYDIRLKYHSVNSNLLSLKTSSYNCKKIVNMCEKCNKNIGIEVHHLQYQKDAKENGIIYTKESTFHKNNLANLITLCEKCHNEIHKNNTKLKKVKTTKGIQLKEI